MLIVLWGDGVNWPEASLDNFAHWEIAPFSSWVSLPRRELLSPGGALTLGPAS